LAALPPYGCGVPLGGIVPAGEQDLLLEVLAVEPLVVDGELGSRVGVQGVEQFGVVQEHGCFVLFRGNGVVDIGEAYGLGEFAPILKKTIRPETADGDGVLYRFRYLEVFSVLLQRGLQGLNQVSIPP